MNSKATLRLPGHLLFPLIPTLIHQEVRHSRFYAVKSDSISIQADGSRSQRKNVEECFTKLHDLLVAAGKTVLPGATSQAQRNRVRGLYVSYGHRTNIVGPSQVADASSYNRLLRQERAAQARLITKRIQSSKKAARKGQRRPD